MDFSRPENSQDYFGFESRVDKTAGFCVVWCGVGDLFLHVYFFGFWFFFRVGVRRLLSFIFGELEFFDG